MTFRLSLKGEPAEFRTAFNRKHVIVAEAATETILEVRKIFEVEARANIAQAGFSKRWQTGYRVKKFPRSNKPSVDVAAFGYHRIGYANVFERGANIKGKPLLWLPLSHAPKKIGREKMTPKNYTKLVGPLQYVKRAGKPPLLLAKQSGRGKVTIGKLRAGASGSGRSVPLFVGIKAVTIASRFDISAVAERVASRLPEIYASNFAAVND